MSSLTADIGIWTLLVIGTVFCGLGLTGLLIFPDTRSRMFTAFRATAIGLGAVIFAVITYGYTMFMTTGGDQYPALILRVLFLALVLAAGTKVMYGIIHEHTLQEKPENSGQVQDSPGPSVKDGK